MKKIKFKIDLIEMSNFTQFAIWTSYLKSIPFHAYEMAILLNTKPIVSVQ